MAMEIRQTEKMQMHRRKSSKEEDEILHIPSEHNGEGVGRDRVAVNRANGLNGINGPDESNMLGITLGLPPRNRVSSTPQHCSSHSLAVPPTPPSPGPFRTSLGRAQNGVSGHPSSPFRATFSVPSHSRTRSTSTPFSPSLSSPLSSAFPSQPHSPSLSPTNYTFPAMTSGPELSVNTNGQHTRRHSRVHSRNLSVFFPRPGSLPHTSIAEDGTQELQVDDEKSPISAIPTAGSNLNVGASRQLGAGFTFGARPPGGSPGPTPDSGGPIRRGHHHKHSLSHNFFSFLEPGGQSADLRTQPTPTPVSPWTPVSTFPQSPAPSTTSFSNDSAVDENEHHNHTHTQTHTHTHDHSLKTTAHHYHREKSSPIPPVALTFAVAQFLLGSWLWVTGQQIGSLSCTGLGYWVVFDAFGVAISWVVPAYLSTGAESVKAKLRRPYGNARIETVLMFAQSVYLMFSSVYVCKETVEHLLLSAGEGQGHHHHKGDEEGLVSGIEFPIFLSFITLLSLIGTAFGFGNHSYLVNITGNRLPSFPSLVRSCLSSRSRSYLTTPHEGPLSSVLSNPFVASPLSFCVAILIIGGSGLVPGSHHRIFDLTLAAIETIVTFNVAYRACVILGTVLLQTSPPRGLSAGRMEAFLRVMRELERHPQVLHLPAPHIWQLTPTHPPSSSSPSASKFQALVVTLELHVREDLDDADVIKLTRWAWEKCVRALGGGLGKDAGEEAEVTVGIVRG